MLIAASTSETCWYTTCLVLTKRLWSEEDGALVVSELILIGTILIIGLVVGLSAIQTAIVTELGDFAASFGSLNQSFSVGGISAPGSSTAGSGFTDAPDAGDTPAAANPQGNSACIQIINSNPTPG